MPDEYDHPRPCSPINAGIARMDSMPRLTNRWLWEGHLPRAKLTLLAGEPGTGKSSLAMDLAARLTKGSVWPDGQPIHRPSQVLMLCAEDDATDTVLPRLLAAGADLERVYLMTPSTFLGNKPRAITFPRDIGQLEVAIDRAAAPKLIIIDPLAAYLGPAGDWGGEVQSRLSPLIDLAARAGASILAISHRDLLGTPRRKRSNPALTFTAASRVAWQVVVDDANPGRRLLIQVKNNLSPIAKSLAFTMGHDRIEWVDATTSEPVANPSTEAESAAAWLSAQLKDGPVISSKLFEEGMSALFSRSTLRRAARGWAFERA